MTELTAADVLDQGKHRTIAAQSTALGVDAAGSRDTARRRAAEALTADRLDEAGRYLLQATRYAATAQTLVELGEYLEARRRRIMARAVAQGTDHVVVVDEQVIALRVYLDQSTTLLRSSLTSASDLAAPATDLVRARMQGYADALVQFAVLIRNALTGGE